MKTSFAMIADRDVDRRYFSDFSNQKNPVRYQIQGSPSVYNIN